jgi:hypothetical protein
LCVRKTRKHRRLLPHHKAATPPTRLPVHKLLPLLLAPPPRMCVRCLLVRLCMTTTPGTPTSTSSSTGLGTLPGCSTPTPTVPTPGQAEATYLPHASCIGSEGDLVDCGKDLRVGIVPIPQHVVVTSAFRVCLPVVPDRSTLHTSHFPSPPRPLCWYSLNKLTQMSSWKSCWPRRMRWTRASSFFFLSFIGSLFCSCFYSWLYRVFAYTQVFLLTSLSHILAPRFSFFLICVFDYISAFLHNTTFNLFQFCTLNTQPVILFADYF